VPVVLVVLATSPCRPWPYCSLFPPREQLLAATVEGAVVVGGRGGRPCPCLPLVVVVVAQLGVLGRACRSVVVPLRLPVVVVVVGVPVSSPDLAWSPSPTREQLLAAAVGRCRPVLPPANGGER
jgi:hypothetical protein